MLNTSVADKKLIQSLRVSSRSLIRRMNHTHIHAPESKGASPAKAHSNERSSKAARRGTGSPLCSEESRMARGKPATPTQGCTSAVSEQTIVSVRPVTPDFK
ncbi:hypothetical protein MHYP_G00285840 [Metynnis hypsauchen]